MDVLKLSLKARLKQFFCNHKDVVGFTCCSKGINSKAGHWHVTYECDKCKMTYGKWIKATDEEVDKLFENEIHKLG